MFTLRSLLIAAAYLVTGWLGLKTPYLGSHITLVWLPTGIAVFGLFRWGSRLLPGIYLAACAVNLALGSSWPLAAGIAIGNAMAPWFAAQVLRHYGFIPGFDRQRDVGLLVLAAGLGMTVSAWLGSINLHFAGLAPWSAVPRDALAWWMGDAMGVLLAAPFLLTFQLRPLACWRKRRWELSLWLLLAGLVVWFAFVQPHTGIDRILPMAFMTLPLLAWAALRFGVAGTTTSMLAFSLAGTLSAASGHGYFALAGQQAGPLMVWGYMATQAFTGLLILALQGERRQIENTLSEHDEKLQGLYELSPLGIALVDMQGHYIEFNEAFRRICGYSAEELRGLDYWTLTPRQYEADEARQLQLLEQTGHYGPYEKEYIRKDGSLVPLRLNGMLITGRDGQRYIWSIVEDITDRKANEEEIRRLAFYDPLTQLPNRRLLLDRLRHALAKSARSQQYGALLFIDLDNFKALNDTRGHGTGDRLLQQVAQRLSGCVRRGDTVARLGGDEFVVLLEAVAAEAGEAATAAEQVGLKIRAALTSPYALDDSDYQGTPSIGVVLFDGRQETTDTLLRQADLAMYQAKAGGRNTICFFDPAMQAVASARVQLEGELRSALQLEQLQLYYQVQVDAGGRPTGAEALLRWRHPQRGLVAPGEFIALAEETGLILPIGLQVLRDACAQLARWSTRSETAGLAVAINVSTRQLHQADFVEQVLGALRESGAPAQRLKLELTESVLMQDVDANLEKILALNAAGVQFALDDFGTGYSSLYYLKRLPFEKLKIDRSFVMNLQADPYDAALVKTIVELARSLGVDVIAEGVETAAQRDFLGQLGCHAYQGYLFGKPMPPEEFERTVPRLGQNTSPV